MTSAMGEAEGNTMSEKLLDIGSVCFSYDDPAATQYLTLTGNDRLTALRILYRGGDLSGVYVFEAFNRQRAVTRDMVDWTTASPRVRRQS
jgi:hypothetical protein